MKAFPNKSTMTKAKKLAASATALLFVATNCVSAIDAPTPAPKQRTYRIMAVGDSITEGDDTFVSYRFLLWEKLISGGYVVEYVGSRSRAERIGPFQHEGYGGKNAEFLANTVSKSFQEHPADIVLLASGHNYTSEEQPVPKILAATESLIGSFRKVNPQVTVLLAQVIPSGKLPKYEYIPQLNAELIKLAQRLNEPGQPVVSVNLAEGFDWTTDTIADKVHPNAKGAEKIASRWFAALTQVMEKPPVSYQPRIFPYKKSGAEDLKLHVFAPSDNPNGETRPAIVFFFGGGWTLGTPLQFYPECAHFASKGMVAISVDYRIRSRHNTTPFESVADGKSAIRWIRQHAKELGVDPERIVAAGASAGGQVAAACGIVKGLDDPSEDQSVSSRPNAMILWYPALDNGPGGCGFDMMKDRYLEISPLHNIAGQTPPTLFFLGTKDALIPVKTAEEFKARVEQGGGRCELRFFEGAPHPIYEYRKGYSPRRQEILTMSDDFLMSLGFLKK